jgi:superfamily II DNA or RNA helicase
MLITFDYKSSTGKLYLTCSDSAFFSQLREYFSVENKGAHFARRRGRFVAARKYVITPTGVCDIGLYWEIRKYLIEHQVICDVVLSDTFTNAINTNTVCDVYSDFKFELRDYQLDVIKKALKLGQGTCVLGTGAGKTFTTAALIQNYYEKSNNKQTFKCLLIVPDLGLVEQTYNEFSNCGVTFTLSKWTGNNELDLCSNVIICNVGILQSRFSANDWVKFVDLLVIDECHMIRSGNSISSLISKIKTRNRYGFTGTLPEEQIDRWNIIGKIGPIIYEKSSAELRHEDFLVNVEVKVIKMDYNESPKKITKDAYRNELEFLFTNNHRNSFISKLCEKLTNNTLILVNYIVHGEELFSMLSSLKNKQVFFIRGEVDVDTREEIKKLMEVYDNVVCIAISKIFSTGINVKNLHNIVFASGGKSFVRTVQSIGRGLRKHHNKTKLIIFDIADNLTYGQRHATKRQEIYKQEKIKFNIISIKPT